MRTNFKLAALCDPHLAEAERNLRACVHCGICTATCPTYVLLGDERDGPRGRIVMIQQMLEQGGAPKNLVLAPDASLKPAEVFFETSQGILDASVETQLREIERGLIDKLER